MKKSEVVGSFIVGAICLAAIGILVLALNEDPDAVAPPNVLVTIALNGSSAEERELAALDLARSSSPEATEALRRVLAETREPKVLAAVVQGLGVKKDLKSFDKLTTIARDGNHAAMVRGRAGVAMTKIIGDADFGWSPDNEQTPAQLEKLDAMAEMGQLMVKYGIKPR